MIFHSDFSNSSIFEIVLPIVVGFAVCLSVLELKQHRDHRQNDDQGEVAVEWERHLVFGRVLVVFVDEELVGETSSEQWTTLKEC